MKKESISFKQALWVVLGLHVVAVFGIFFFAGTKKTQAAEDKNFLKSKEAVYVGIPDPVATHSSSFPTSRTRVVSYPKLPSRPIKSIPEKQAQTYIISKGDNLYRVSRKFKINFEKLKELNNIKDPNKIYIGQTLKLM
jgi:LysM repeat protein